MEYISEEIFGKYSKIKILDLTFLKKVKYLGLKTENFNGSIWACTVFYLPIFRGIEGGGVEPVPERVTY